MGSGKIFTVDLHMHTEYSIDSLSRLGEVLAAAVKKGLNAIAITDHDQIAGALEAQKIAKKERLALQVIIGEEVSTDAGDLLCYFVKRRISPGPLAAVLAEVEKQGAICSAAHPYDFMRHGIAVEKLSGKLLSQIHAIEAFNARITVHSHNSRALEFAHKHGKPVLAGSDAHHPSEVGSAWVEFEGIRRLDRRSLLSAPRKLHGKVSPKYVHLFSRYAVMVKKGAKLLNRQ